MVFGLVETGTDTLAADVHDMLQDIGVAEPHVASVVRLGAETTKVVLKNTEVAKRILQNAKQLKKCDKRKRVYLAPDRTREERDEHTKLVIQMKQMIKKDPGKYFFIRNKKVCSTDRKNIGSGHET